MSDRKRITVTLEEISCYEFDKSVTDLIVLLDDFVQKYGPSVYLDYDGDHYYPYDSSPTPMYFLKLQRDETDEEMTERLKKEELKAEQQKARDLEQLEILKKRLGI